MKSTDGPSESLVEARRLRREGVLLNNEEQFESAEPLLIEAVLQFEAYVGVDDEETQDALNALAVCRFNQFRVLEALQTFERLARSLQRTHGEDDPLSQLTRRNVLKCLDEWQATSPVHASPAQ